MARVPKEMGTGLMGMYRAKGPKIQMMAVIRPTRVNCLTVRCVFVSVVVLIMLSSSSVAYIRRLDGAVKFDALLLAVGLIVNYK